MTNPVQIPVPTPYLPRCTTIKEWMTEATVLWSYVSTLNKPELKAEVEKLFRGNQAAQSDPVQCEKMIKDIRQVLGLNTEHEPDFSLPFGPPGFDLSGEQPTNPPAPPTPPVPVPAETPAAPAEPSAPASQETEPTAPIPLLNVEPDLGNTGENGGSDGNDENADAASPSTESDEEPNEDGPEDTDQVEGSHEDDQNPDVTPTSPGDEPASTFTPTPSTPPTWPDSAIGNGLISGLARTLKSGEILQLVIVRSGDHLSVTVQPGKIAGELDATNLGFTATGTPAQLDAELADAMPSYQAARKTAREIADELANNVAKAAHDAKVAAEKKKTEAAKPAASATKKSVPTDKRPSLALTIKHGGEAAKGKTSVELVSDNKANNLKKTVTGSVLSEKVNAGKYMLTVSAEGHQPHTQTVELKEGVTKPIEIDLKPIGTLPLL